MTTADLYVAFSQPHYGNYAHWALFLAHELEPLIFEVVGSHGTFVSNVMTTKPENSDGYVGRQFVYSVNVSDIPEMRDVIKNFPVDNDTLEWDCQDYVIEILEKLADEFIIEEESRSFKRAMRMLKDRRGPL